SFLLVKLEPGVDRSVVAEGIEAGVNDADVFFPEVLAEQDAELGRTFFGPIMQLLISVGYLIGVLVTAIIMFSAVNVRRHEFGVLKALGFSHLFLSASVVVEAMIYALAAIPIGIALASLVSQLIEVLMPLYLILPTEAGPVLRTATACIVFAVVGALVPIRLIRRVDPSVVFRS
ncbi:MAG: ABC transporter permease, partial [Pseudomonadales bacterium]